MKLSDFKSRYIVLNVVPSLDTTVCDMQTRTVNKELTEREDVLVLTISNDLPFAQARWCGNSGLPNVITLSDHYDLDFASQYGTHIKELDCWHVRYLF
jgi:thioredoxin-dependent peroxiredoxin